jgi:hypothetical protein
MDSFLSIDLAKSARMVPENNLISPQARLRFASLEHGFSFTLGYHGEFGEHFRENAIEGEMRKAFALISFRSAEKKSHPQILVTI